MKDKVNTNRLKFIKTWGTMVNAKILVTGIGAETGL